MDAPTTLAPSQKKDPFPPSVATTGTPLTPSPRASRAWLWALLTVAIFGGVFVFWYKRTHAETGSGGPSAPRRGAAPIPVLADTAIQGSIGVFLNGLGSVTPLSAVTVKSRVDGQLMKVNFVEGQLVKEGDLLAEIDPRPYDVQVLQAEGQLTRDEALLKNAQADVDRYKTLWDQKAIAQQILAAQEATAAQFEGTVKSDQAQLQNAKLNQTYARITAPVSGRVGLRQMDAGNMVHASDAGGLVSITQLQPITVVFTIPQDQVPVVLKKLNAGEKLGVDAYDREQRVKLAKGYLLTVDNQIDSSTGTLKCKAIFTNEDSTLFPNQFVNIRLLVETKENVVLVPGAAIQRGAQQSTYVYAITDLAAVEKGKSQEGAVAIRNVVLGTSEGDVMEIRNGLHPGDIVVLEGVDKLQQGTKVSVRMKAEEAASPTSGIPVAPVARKKKA